MFSYFSTTGYSEIVTDCSVFIHSFVWDGVRQVDGSIPLAENSPKMMGKSA